MHAKCYCKLSISCGISYSIRWRMINFLVKSPIVLYFFKDQYGGTMSKPRDSKYSTINPWLNNLKALCVGFTKRPSFVPHLKIREITTLKFVFSASVNLALVSESSSYLLLVLSFVYYKKAWTDDLLGHFYTTNSLMFGKLFWPHLLPSP